MIPASPYLIVAAHPDDEVLGLGGQFPAFPSPVFVHTTDGAPLNVPGRKEYAARRRRELEAALAIAGLPTSSLIQCGAIDQETAFHLASIARLLRALIADLRPRVIYTHPYEGGHPDHDSTAFCVHAALRLLRRDGFAVPILLEFTSYHNGSPQQQSAWMKTGQFLNADVPYEVLYLSPYAAARKRRMLECFESQREVVTLFPTDVEHTRIAPAYDFTRPPHAGLLFYEAHHWGVTGEQWRRLARESLSDLDLEVPPHDHLLQPDFRVQSFSAA
ncbi:MAG: PIG-L family deacetylase [Bryobacterales bacterium]|nr:PIG-L family deacetylase [Bryobacterales bacterium]